MKRKLTYCTNCKRLFLQGTGCPSCGSDWVVPVTVSTNEKNYYNTEYQKMEYFCDLEQFYHDEIEKSGEYSNVYDWIGSCFCSNGGVLLPVSVSEI